MEEQPENYSTDVIHLGDEVSPFESALMWRWQFLREYHPFDYPILRMNNHETIQWTHDNEPRFQQQAFRGEDDDVAFFLQDPNTFTEREYEYLSGGDFELLQELHEEQPPAELPPVGQEMDPVDVDDNDFIDERGPNIIVLDQETPDTDDIDKKERSSDTNPYFIRPDASRRRKHIISLDKYLNPVKGNSHFGQ